MAGYPSVSTPPVQSGSPFNTWLHTVFVALSGAMQGKLNATTSVTLTANAAMTVLSDPRLTGSSYIGLSPVTANATAEGTPYVTDQDKGTATLNHANNVQTDRTYTVLMIG